MSGVTVVGADVNCRFTLSFQSYLSLVISYTDNQLQLANSFSV